MPKKEKTLQTNIWSKLTANKATRKIGSTRIVKVKSVIKPTAKLSEHNILNKFLQGYLKCEIRVACNNSSKNPGQIVNLRPCKEITSVSGKNRIEAVAGKRIFCLLPG